MHKLNESKFDPVVDPILKPLYGRLEKLGYIFAKREYKIEKDGTHKIRDQYLLGSERLFEIWVSSEYSINASISNLTIDDDLFFTDFLKKKTKETHLDLIERVPSESWAAYASRCVQIIIDLIEHDLNEVMLSKTWIKVPIDWSIMGRD